jgi:hypothetical protein
LTNRSQIDVAEARRSALLVAGVFALIAAWNLYRDREAVAMISGGASALLLLIGAFSPVASQAFHRAWMGLAHVLGWVNSRILLSVLFYVVLTPIAIVQRLLGRNMLGRRGAGSGSYWIRRKTDAQSPEQFERLF